MNDVRLLLHADPISRKILNLQFKQISNLQLMMPLLTKFQNLQILSLNGNRLQSLPQDMSGLQKLYQLDISNNLFRDVEDIISSLKTLPKLTHLIYTFKDEKEEALVKKQLKNLQRINKKPLNNAVITSRRTKQTGSVMKLNEKDLQQIAQIYDDIRQVYKRSKYFVDKQLAEQFDKGVDTIMGELSTKLIGAANEDEINTSIVNCRYALIDLCFVKLITYFYHFDKNIASILQRVHDYMAESFSSVNQILSYVTIKSKKEINNIIVKKEDLFKAEIKRLKNQQQIHLSELSMMQAKNAQLLEKLTRNSKSNVLQTTINNVIKKRSTSKSPLKQRTAGNNVVVSELPKMTKNLTLHQLKQVINEIYTSKAKHNLICRQSNNPMETLEAHMYTYLNQKYGLKPMTVEWAMSIVNGIRKYGNDDSEVATFGKILRNEVQEDFVESLKKNKFTIRQAIKKFKISEESSISPFEAQEILLVANFKRDSIDQIVNRIKPQKLVNGHLTSPYFEHLMLDFMLRKHEQRIRKLSSYFKEVDIDQDGIINYEQLFELFDKDEQLRSLDIDEFIQLIDPHATNSITFSHLCEQMLREPKLKEFFG